MQDDAFWSIAHDVGSWIVGLSDRRSGYRLQESCANPKGQFQKVWRLASKEAPCRTVETYARLSIDRQIVDSLMSGTLAGPRESYRTMDP